MSHSPKQLILNLLKESQQPESTDSIVRLGEIFGFAPNNMRVTLTRLASQQFLKIPQRGHYQLGEQAQAIANEQSSWREFESSFVEWDGSWIAIYVAHLGRTNRKLLRQRIRVLSFWGFEEFEQGLLIRPANLGINLGHIRQRLIALGLEADARLFRITDLDAENQQRAKALWNANALSQGYRNAIEEMNAWLIEYPNKTLNEAAKESFLIGDQVLRQIAYDPRLPKEMVDTELRSIFIKTMVHFDDIGRSIWSKLHERITSV